MPEIVDELATVLFDLDERPLTTGAMTARITRATVEWALSHGWAARTEARVDVESLGFVDVIVHRPGAGPDVAIEIDSANKPWSVTKLRHAAAAGMHALWIRWGDEEWAGTYDEVDVIQLPVRRRPAQRAASDAQLAFWR